MKKSKAEVSSAELEHAARRARRLVLAALIVSCGWLALHVVSTAAYLMPVSRLTARVYPVVSPYLLPYFRQRWALFAPDPDGKSKYFQFRCELRDAAGSVTITPLHNMSERFYERPWETRLGPGFKVHRVYHMPLSYFRAPDFITWKIAQYLAKGDPEAERRLEAESERYRLSRIQEGRELAARLASAACRRQFPDANIVRSYAAFDIVYPQPYAQRDRAQTEPPRIERLEIGWLPFDASVRLN